MYTERPVDMHYHRPRFRNNFIQVKLTPNYHQEEKRPVIFVTHTILPFTTINANIK